MAKKTKTPSRRSQLMKKFRGKDSLEAFFTVSYQENGKKHEIEIEVRFLLKEKRGGELEVHTMYYDAPIYDLLEEIGIVRCTNLESQLDEKIKKYTGVLELDEIYVA